MCKKLVKDVKNKLIGGRVITQNQGSQQVIVWVVC